MTFDRQIKKYVGLRNWDTICSTWVEYLPTIDPPGSNPEHTVSEFLENNYGLRIDEVLGDKNRSPHYFEIPGLRQAIFREGIFLLHKSVHVMSNVENDVERGVITWSLSEGYQGAFFGVRAIQSFLGVTLVEVKDRWLIIDIWPEKIKESGKKRAKVSEQDTLVQLIATPRIEHLKTWILFKRLIAVSKVKIWPSNIIKSLAKIREKEFARQRNRLHYGNNIWFFDDLYKPILDEHFGKRNSLEYNLESDFSVKLIFEIVELAYLLFESVNNLSNMLRSEKELIENDLNSDRHPRWK